MHSHHPLPRPDSDAMVRSAVAWRYLQRTRYNALSMGRKTPKIAPSLWDFVTLPKEDRATTIGNMHKNSKDRASDRQTDRQTDTETDRLMLLITILRSKLFHRTVTVTTHWCTQFYEAATSSWW